MEYVSGRLLFLTARGANEEAVDIHPVAKREQGDSLSGPFGLGSNDVLFILRFKKYVVNIRLGQYSFWPYDTQPTFLGIAMPRKSLTITQGTAQI